MTIAIYNEIDPFAARWLECLVDDGHIARGIVYRRSVRALQPHDVAGPGQRHFFAGIGGWSYALRLAGVPDDADVWTGSCPCQPFSEAGSHLGFDDDRHLWPDWFRLISECRPSIVFGEQVASRDGLTWLDAVRADMEGAGYAFGAADLCAAGVGAPHIRQRLWWVAIANSARISRPAPDRVGARGYWSTSLSTRRLPRVVVAGRWWTEDQRPDRLPTLVPNDDGISKVLAGVGNAVVPELAAVFVRASLGM